MPDRIARVIFGVVLLTFAAWILPSSNWAATLYAKQEGVKVNVEKSPTSPVIATLAMGDAVTVLAEEGRLAKVKTATGKTGWVFKFRLSTDKPSTRSGSGLSGLTGRKLAARESQAGGSIRGLKESTEQYANAKQIKQEHRDAVDQMEAFSISPDELMQFKKTGHLGEYSGGAQ